MQIIINKVQFLLMQQCMKDKQFLAHFLAHFTSHFKSSPNVSSTSPVRQKMGNQEQTMASLLRSKTPDFDRIPGQNLLSRIKQLEFLIEHYSEFSEPVKVFVGSLESP